MTILSSDDREHFGVHGYVRVPGAFSADGAARMRDVVWTALEREGIRRDDPQTWAVEAPSHLQDFKKAEPFGEIATERTIGAIDELMGADRWSPPRDWGAFFLMFPTSRPWQPPAATWHLDHPYTDPVAPLAGMKIHSLFGDVAPRAGGMTVIDGSHHVVVRYATAAPPAADDRAADTRAALMRSDPWLAALETAGEPEARIARFVEHTGEAWGVPVRVVELTGDAGDVILIHPLLLHSRPTNAGASPRFLLNKDIRAAGG